MEGAIGWNKKTNKLVIGIKEYNDERRHHKIKETWQNRRECSSSTSEAAKPSARSVRLATKYGV